MPCYDERTSPSYMNAEFDKERRRLQNRLNKVTELLCSTCKFIDTKTKGSAYDEVEGLNAWWDAHQKQDRLHEIADRAIRKGKKHV